MRVELRTVPRLDDALSLAPELDEHLAEVCAEWRDEPPRAGAGTDLLRRVLGTPEGCVVVALLESGERIGVCLSGPLLDPLLGETQPMLLVLRVDPGFRRRGLARQLLQALSEELRGRGFRTLAARAGHNDDALISMGERWGFVRTFETMLREDDGGA